MLYLILQKINQEAGLKAIESGEKNKQAMLDEAYADQLISQRDYNIESKKLTRDGIEARLAISEATLKSLMSAEFQSEETRKKALETQKAEIDKLKEELRKAGIDLKGLLVDDAVDVGEQMQKNFRICFFLRLAICLQTLQIASMRLKVKILTVGQIGGMAIGGIVQSALATATQINDQYYEYRAAKIEADKQRELTAAGESSSERERIERDYAQKELDLKKETIKFRQCAKRRSGTYSRIACRNAGICTTWSNWWSYSSRTYWNNDSIANSCYCQTKRSHSGYNT